MKKKVTLKRILHHNVWRYGIYFNYDPAIISVVKKMPGVLYSGTNKCWHLPAEESALKAILSALRDIADIDISRISSPSEAGKDDHNQGRFSEITVNSEESHDAGMESVHQVTVSHVSGSSRAGINFGPVRFSIRDSDSRLIIKFLGRYDPDWIREIKSYGRVFYNKVSREWLLQWSQITVDSLADYFMSRGIEVKVEKAVIPVLLKEKRSNCGTEVRDRKIDDRTEEGIRNVKRYLDENRYSANTTDAYISLLKLFFKYHNTKSPAEITEGDITDFFHDYVFANKYSSSYQNQMISAIKLYYSINGNGNVRIMNLVRPRRGRSLPKVFSKEEVKKILSATHNLKHKLILWIIYSCGLRRSEVINIRLRDLNRERGILNIIEAKGMVDRIVPVPAKVWEKIDEYLESYHPVIYLFEGQSGGRYSVESVYRVFKRSLRRAGIDKEVGVHSLRHSYATHLHESGLDIKYIQELLGHKSMKTTEIYTHVSRRNLMDIRNPIDDMDLK
jgi:integrase/recombinase XerD